MFSDIAIGRYYPVESSIHRLDPRTKIFAVFIYMTGLFIVSSKFGYGAYLLAAIATIVLAKIPLLVMLRSLKPLWFIVIFTMLLHFFVTPGKVVWKLWLFSVTYEGLRFGIFMGLRLMLLIIFTSLLTLTTTPINLTDGLEKILRPFSKLGVPAHELAMMMTIALRFIPTLAEELEKIMKAQMARGADFHSGNLLKRAKNLVPLLVPLFISSFRRADELALAMEARCYRGGENRTRMYELKMHSGDFITYGLLGAMLISTIILHSMVKF